MRGKKVKELKKMCINLDPSLVELLNQQYGSTEKITNIKQMMKAAKRIYRMLRKKEL